MLRKASLIVVFSLCLPLGGQQSKRLAPSPKRNSVSDLELLTLDSSGARSSRVFLSRGYLATLPQVSVVLKPDENFSEIPVSGVRITGVDLNVLMNLLAPSDSSANALAVCRDGYTSPFPRQAIRDHHPILVYAIDGLSSHQWAVKHSAIDPGPYFVTYGDFVPSFRILGNDEFAQHPAEILLLKLLPDASLFATIAPPQSTQMPRDAAILDGFHIAQQNCFRCHNSGETGGNKAHQSWEHLGEIAKSRPDFFAAWVHNPRSIDPHARMPPNLKYDQATLKALTRYFQTFAPAK